MEGSGPHVVALLIVGARPEPWLPAVLESLADAVDSIVVNDNSGDPASANRRALEACRLWREGRADVFETAFVNFSDARNRCLARIAERQGRLHEEVWVLKVDADEVHDGRLRAVTRGLLPWMPRGLGVVDGYFLQFMQSPLAYIALDRRHDLFFRFNSDLAWERDVHEQLRGLRGGRLCLPYVFFHYGYVAEEHHILGKWKLYRDLGDRTYGEEELGGVATADMLERDVHRCIPYRRSQPPALGVLPSPPRVAGVEAFNRRVSERLRQPLPFLVTLARRVNYRARLLWRAALACRDLPPRAWALLFRMALQ